MPNGAGFPAHQRTVGCIVDFDARHARQARNALLDQPDTRSTRDAFQHQRRFARMIAEVARRCAFYFGNIVSNQVAHFLRQAVLAQRQRTAVPVIGSQAVVGYGLRDRLATGAAHRARGAVDRNRKLQSARHRQAAVITLRTKPFCFRYRGHRLARSELWILASMVGAADGYGLDADQTIDSVARPLCRQRKEEAIGVKSAL